VLTYLATRIFSRTPYSFTFVHISPQNVIRFGPLMTSSQVAACPAGVGVGVVGLAPEAFVTQSRTHAQLTLDRTRYRTSTAKARQDKGIAINAVSCSCATGDLQGWHVRDSWSKNAPSWHTLHSGPW